MSEVFIQIEKGGIKTVINEAHFVSSGYKKAGWKKVETDWTKERTVNPPINVMGEMDIKKLGEGAK